MTNEEMSLEIIKVLATRCADNKTTTFMNDWGYGAGTLILDNEGHSHFGLDLGDNEEEQLHQFIEGLYKLLCKNEGLSFVK